jgi:hypothetical protein
MLTLDKKYGSELNGKKVYFCSAGYLIIKFDKDLQKNLI